MTEPVDLDEARAQVNIIDPADTTFDSFLTSLIPQARAYVERSSSFFWVAASRSETFGSWSDGKNRHRSYDWGHRRGRGEFLEIYRRPIASIDTVTYTDETGTDQTYTGFLAPVDRFPVRISPAIDDSFPCLGRGGRIKVDYTSGALDAASEEYVLGKRAMLLLLGHWFANRESVLADNRAATVEVTQTVSDIIDLLRPVSAY